MSEVICRSKGARKDIFTDESDFSQQTWTAGPINAVGDVLHLLPAGVSSLNH